MIFVKNEIPKTAPWQEAKDFGVDIQMLKDNLRLSYYERACKHQQQALENLELLLEPKERQKKSQFFNSSFAALVIGN